jgi:predicted AlkP superfamily pyrophosphatase or phosphodiesterase
MHQTVVINVVGLSPELLGPHTPHLSAFARAGALKPLETITPAVTCSVQASMVTGLLPRDHGIVANGWYFRELAEVALWKQSNQLVGGEKIWEAAKKQDPSFTCAKLFWWYNMYSSAEYSLTPRPIYTADGQKLPDVYSEPPELRAALQAELGPFPLFNFWGPRADVVSSRWITRAAARVFDQQKPTLTLVYVPHLDYNLQRLGPRHPRIAEDLREVDALCGELIDHVQRRGARVIVLSEYGITEVSGAVHPNRVLRDAGLVRIRDELGQDKLDCGASEAFAVADHQLAHVYVKRPERVREVRALLEKVPGVDIVLGADEKYAFGLDHPRSGELVLISQADRWFSYYFWQDDARAPDYARTVDIHKKPGYDPVELFIDPKLKLPMLKVARKLAQKKLGFRTLLDVIPLDTSLVKGSHGRVTDRAEQGPLFMSSEAGLVPERVLATDVKRLVLEHLTHQVPRT